jgi:hypothetical protein
MRRALITLALALVRPACCMKEQLSIEDDYRRIVVIDNFGFHKNGQINLKMTDLTVSALSIHSAGSEVLLTDDCVMRRSQSKASQ